MNIKQHAIMRYCQRMNDEYIINDETFKSWRRANEDKVVEAENEILKLFGESKIDITTTSSDNPYKINTNENWIFVYDGENIITCYKLEYKGLNEKTNKTIIDALLQEYYDKLPKINQHIENYNNSKSEFDERTNQIDGEIKLLNKKINNLKEQKKIIKDSLTLKENELTVIREEFDILQNKIVKPDYFFK